VMRVGAAGVALGLAALLAQDASARVCRFAPRPLASPRDSAAWCAREFLIRNGYTKAPPSADRGAIALEPTMDVGKGLDEVLSNRRNTVSEEPQLACTTATGYLVSFTMPNQLNQPYGRGVAMTEHFVGITLLRPWVLLGAGAGPNCSVPRLPPPSP
jgi:hypothetical protein